MKTYSVAFDGIYPVGAVAIIIADSKEEAETMMKQKLKDINIPNNHIYNIEEIKADDKKVIVLLDGDY